jgi:hypothetical protein
MNSWRRLEITEKKIFPIVEVMAMGLNSDTVERSSDLDKRTINAKAHSSGISFVSQILIPSFYTRFVIAGHFL